MRLYNKICTMNRVYVTIKWYKKKYKEFCQIRLILPIKIYYITDFENFWSREYKFMAKKRIFWSITPSFFDLEKIFIIANPQKRAKILGVFSVKFFFSATTKYTKVWNLCKFDYVRKWININFTFREKFHLKYP